MQKNKEQINKKKIKNKTILKQNKPPVVKPAWYQTGTSLVKLLGNLSVKSVDDFQYYKSISSENSSTCNYDPKFYKQRTAEWFNARKGKINGSKAATALGWYGKKAMNDYWNDLSNDLHGVTKELEMNQIWQCYGVLSTKTVLLSPT